MTELQNKTAVTLAAANAGDHCAGHAAEAGGGVKPALAAANAGDHYVGHAAETSGGVTALGARLFHAHAVHGADSGTSTDQACAGSTASVGDPTDWRSERNEGLHEIIIRTNELVKQYGDVTAVDHLNLEIHKGEVFGLLGPNGAGKTTTTLMLLGLTDPTSGTAEINGLDCTRDALAVKKIVGYLPDNVGFYPDMSGRENLIFSGMMNGLTRKEAEERAVGLLERVGMTYAADRKTGTYSRGMRQRLGIADVLMKDPEIIIMDEPTLGIDPSGMRELTALIRELSVKDGRTILISSHELYQIQEISDRVGIFVKGRMIACGRIDELGQQLQNEGLYMVDFRAEKTTDGPMAIEHRAAVKTGTARGAMDAAAETLASDYETSTCATENETVENDTRRSAEEMKAQVDREDSSSDRSRPDDRAVDQSVSETEELKALVRGIAGVRLVGVKEDGTLHVESGRDIRAELFRKLADAGYLLSELHERGGDLDEIYRKYFEKAGGDENYDNRTEQHKEKRSLREKLLRRNR